MKINKLQKLNLEYLVLMFVYTAHHRHKKMDLNKTDTALLNRLHPPMEECNSPSKINQLLRMDRRDLRKSLHEIKQNKLLNMTKNDLTANKKIERMGMSKQFDGSRTFHSDAQINSIRKKTGHVSS